MPFVQPAVQINFSSDADHLAQQLIGAFIFYNGVGGRIVETEAYDQSDPASHSFRGKTMRNSVMFGAAGHAYVYRSYGLHWCLNIVCGELDRGAAVLLRAIEPLQGLDQMRKLRGPMRDELLCAGPGRLCQALGISSAQNGLSLSGSLFSLLPSAQKPGILTGPRIGISKGVDAPLRFGLMGSPFLSKPFR